MGDDLGDDFDFLSSNVRETIESDGESNASDVSNTKKRKLQVLVANNDDDDSFPKKRTPSNLLIAAGRRIEEQSIQEQASFLSIMMRHHQLLSSPDQASDRNAEIADAFRSEFFVSERKSSLQESITSVIPQNKLRKWKHRMSPAVVIVTISARRAVAILKELADLKVRAAKLFPKTGTVKAQIIHLRKHPCPIAVGTPQRLSGLLNDTMVLDNTQLLILDAHSSQKDYTVCTLPDTARHVAELLQDRVLPQLKKRKDFKLAFF